MQSLFRPVWMFPNGIMSVFIGNIQKNWTFTGFLTPSFAPQKNTIIPEQAIHHTRYRYRNDKGGQALSLPSYYLCFLCYRFLKKNSKDKKKLFFYLCQIPCIHLVPVYEIPECFDKLHPVILVV